jgi:hypothetical protein
MMATYRQLLESLNLSESEASDKAKKAGLVSKGGGAWAKEKGGPTVAKTVDGELQSVGGGDDTGEEEPKKTSGKENPKRERGGKDKTLTNIDTSNSEFYNEDIEPNDKNYKTPKGFETPPPPFKFPDDISNGKFPKKYATLVERMMNSQRKGKKPPITDFISGGGAGANAAQAGEVMTMMASSMSDEEWDKTSKMLLDKAEEQKKAGIKGIVDKSWIEAAGNNRKAINNQILGKFPEGTEITHTGWDTEEDTKAMGWTDYKGQKGFSSDIYVKVKLPNGETQMHEVSLKKDKNINFLNSGTGKFRDWAPEVEGTDIDPAVHQTKERKRLADFGEKNKSEIEKLAGSNKELKALMKDKGFKSVDDFIPPSNRSEAKAAFTAMNALAGAPKFGYDNKSGKVLPEPPETDAQKAVAEQVESVRKYAEDATNAIVENPTLKKSMMDDIRSEFPLKSVADDEETMAIGDMSLDKKTMTSIFGTDDFKQIKEHLIVDDSTNPPFLAYEGEAGGERLRVASIIIRQDGIGYGGGSMRFDMAMAPDFADKMKQANEEVYGEKKEQYESLEGTISRIKR